MPRASGLASKLAEDFRSRNIKKATEGVDAVYAAREPQYGDFLQALRDRYSASLGDEKQDVDRRTTFDLARRGVTKGSSELDARRRNQRAFIQKLIGAENKAQGSVSRLRSTDEASRQSLMSLIYGGMDASSAAQRASQMMANALQAQQSEAFAGSIGSAVGTGLDIYNYGQQQQEYRRGQESAREELYDG